MLDEATERAWLEQQSSPSGSRLGTTKVVRDDGSTWLYDLDNKQFLIEVEPAPTPKVEGYVTRPMPNEELQATVDTRLPVTGTKTIGNTLYGRVGEEATYSPLQTFGSEAGAARKYREFGGNLYEETANGLRLVMEKPAPSGGAAPQRAPRWPEEVELAQLQIEEKRRALEDPYTQALRQTNQMIDTVQSQIASGQLSLDQGSEMMALARANLRAAMQGATPYQLAEQQRMREQQRQNLAQDMLNQQMASGTSMASSLLSAATQGYGRIYSSTNPPLDFDPMAMARNFIYEMGGGSPQQTALASGILRGAFEGGQPAAAPQAQAGPTPVRTYPQQFPDGQYEVTQWSDGTYTKKFVNSIGATQ